jgi:hypothetical protein
MQGGAAVEIVVARSEAASPLQQDPAPALPARQEITKGANSTPPLRQGVTNSVIRGNGDRIRQQADDAYLSEQQREAATRPA